MSNLFLNTDLSRDMANMWTTLPEEAVRLNHVASKHIFIHTDSSLVVLQKIVSHFGHELNWPLLVISC